MASKYRYTPIKEVPDIVITPNQYYQSIPIQYYSLNNGYPNLLDGYYNNK
ncbi:hypothetical protein DICPUDRAFT_158578 [Dictyostelium purpureum]|uniref:Uncharacterized protein n=1 Tax=Dictyostelium purpureum TaxID=5786 RepID=F1A1Y2_DICPU|nr:uncharacterized protein DICPUDRAFT_158578 [Dictyostelium purpureum]EGC29794.1 hypothetical protein DICPUDRAFT_158578 [Dictyostelium purpureum]|eukprot:XP_003293680.1 hypothetical protein DICPUDRAFT_158578 [Dictyostelium purpureum]